MRPRRVLFRVDASESIGTGHAVRCLALAQALADRGIESRFASRNAPRHFAHELTALGHPVINLDGMGSSEADAIRRHTPRQHTGRPFTAVVTDHYGLGADWLNAARGLGSRHLVIDDLADRQLPCELLVNSNLGVEPAAYAGLVNPKTRLLLGVRYVLLRRAFRNALGSERTAAQVVKTVLVSMGGSDPAHVTPAVVRAVRAALPTAQIDVVLGALYGGEAIVGDDVRVHRAVVAEEMAQLITRADLAVGASGTSAWERCALGLPSVTLRVAPNQGSNAERLADAGAVVDGGPAEALDVDVLARSIRRIANDQEARQTMGRRAKELIDGRGVDRVANHLDGVRVRAAKASDARLLWGWASDPETRSMSLHPDPIPYPDHIRWLGGKLADRSCLLLVGRTGAGPVGQVRFDVGADEAEVSISVAPEHRGTVGGLLLDSAVRRFRRAWPRTSLTAQVKSDNRPSRRLFERAGFELVDEQHGVLRYHASAPVDAIRDRGRQA